MKITKYLLIALSIILAQSCCVYHTTKTDASGKTAEWGVAPYNDRPMDKEENYVKR